jgi:hypothetical protein
MCVVAFYKPRQGLQDFVQDSVLSRIQSATVLPYPEAYLVPTTDDEWCETRYGPPYLRHIADHHTEYCESGSKSALECFRTHGDDPLCVARGVRYNPSPKKGEKHISMNCDLRNFTSELMNLPETPKYSTETSLNDIRDIEDFGNYFFGTGVKEQLKGFQMENNIDQGRSVISLILHRITCVV